IREEGPPSHQSRSGTPTAGGIVFLALGLILYLVFDRSRAGGLVLLALLGGGGLGLVDDLRKVLARQNLGLRAREKVLIQLLTGLLLAFLVYTLSPARVFMGDTGSLALGNALVAAAIVGGVLWYLPVLAVVLVAETVSVIAQVASFKRTGRRILRMSPLHNHFILGGWSDTRVALSFWAVGLIAALLTLALAPAGGRA